MAGAGVEECSRFSKLDQRWIVNVRNASSVSGQIILNIGLVLAFPEGWRYVVSASLISLAIAIWVRQLLENKNESSEAK
jgi:hypothetical protein